MSDLLSRAPRFRATTPGTGKRKIGTVAGTSKVRQSQPPPQRDTVLRLGKKAEYAVDVLAFAGVNVSREGLASVVGGSVRDLMSRVVSRLEEYGVVQVEEEGVSLAPGWLEQLEGGVDIDAHVRAVRLYEKQRGERWAIRGDAKEADEAVRQREKLLEETARACGLEPDQRDPQQQEQDRPQQPEEATVEVSEEEQQPRQEENVATPEEVTEKAEEEAVEEEAVEEGDAILSGQEAREMAREFFGPPDAEVREEAPVPLGELPDLTDEDIDVLVNILAFEAKFGRGEFGWNWADSKALFYQVKPGLWPDADQLARLHKYVRASGGLDGVRRDLAVAGVAA